MKKILILSLLILSPLQASFEQKGLGANHLALSLAGIASTSTDFAAYLNPALLTMQPSNKASFFYRNYYGMKDINQIALDGSFKLFDMPMGICVNRFGNKLYGETTITASTAYKIDENVSLGIGSSFYFLEIQNYNQAWTFGISIAALYVLNDQLTLATVITNINEPTIGEVKETLPLSAVLGISFKPLKEVELLVDIFKEDRYDFGYRFATRINVLKRINILGGIREQINSFSAGLEYETENYSVSYGADIHPELDISHAIGITYVF